VSPSSFCFVATQQRRRWQQRCRHVLLFVLLQRNKEGDSNYCCLLHFVYLQGNEIGDDNKAVIAFFLSFFLYSLLCWSKTKTEGNYNVGIVAFFFLFCYNTMKKAMGATLLLPFFSYSTKGNCNVDVVTFYFCFISTKKATTATLPSPSSFCFVAT